LRNQQFQSVVNLCVILFIIPLSQIPTTNSISSISQTGEITILSAPDDLFLAEGYENVSLTWIAESENANNYTISMNNVIIDSGQWISGTPISISIDNYAKGVYHFNILFSTSNDINLIHSVTIVVIEITPPIISSPSDQYFHLSSTISGSIEWQIVDNLPGIYSVYHNNTLIKTATWENDEPVIFHFNQLELGIHNFTIIAFDETGYYSSDTVMIFVNDFMENKLALPANISRVAGFFVLLLVFSLGLHYTVKRRRGKGPYM
jgi:hypothetical protein